MREIDARVTGFDYTTFHAYTTEVEVDGRTWTLAIRYNTFYQFYTRLTALEKHFMVEFPPKGGLFFSPPPEERQEQLDDFLLSTLAYFDMRGHPKRMEALLGELLQIPEHLEYKDDDEEHTASEGSSVAEELLLDTPMPGHDHNDFDESGHEDDDNDVQEDKSTPQILEKDNQVEADVEVVQDIEELKTEVVEGDNRERPAELGTNTDTIELELEEKPRMSEVVANDYIARLRRQTLVNGAIQAAVVSTMKENVEKSKAFKVEKDVGEQEIATNSPVPEMIPVKEEKPAAFEKAAVQTQSTATRTETKPTVANTTVSEDIFPAVEEAVVEVQEPIEVASTESSIEADLTAVSVEYIQEDDSCLEESDANPSNKEADGENPVVSWFRRMGTFGLSAADKEEQDAAAKKEQEEKEAAIRVQAEAKAREEAAAAEAKAKLEAEAKEAAEAELLRAEQELNLRLMPYRHPVFFQAFNCDVGTSRYSLAERPSNGIVV
ncbi:hypothetical protein F444_05522 [Phytophthora nicotianae P1976]|uniref:PX domain-containing protein n=1 Tax=Phytophthora nicotianae P1976 TaxID=1317066 RepID=A0A081ALU7_PHYNI|nr:hypothetical protein F444_05522 [Phytophthora nicotianae P1976]